MSLTGTGVHLPFPIRDPLGMWSAVDLHVLPATVARAELIGRHGPAPNARVHHRLSRRLPLKRIAFGLEQGFIYGVIERLPVVRRSSLEPQIVLILEFEQN